MTSDQFSDEEREIFIHVHKSGKLEIIELQQKSALLIRAGKKLADGNDLTISKKYNDAYKHLQRLGYLEPMPKSKLSSDRTVIKRLTVKGRAMAEKMMAEE